MNFLESVKNKILEYHPAFNKQHLIDGLNLFSLEKVIAGTKIVATGEIADKLFISNKSISRCYFTKDNGEEQTLWIEPEMRFLADFESFKSGTPSKYNIEFYEDSELYYIERASVLDLYNRYHDWALFGIQIMEEYLLYTFVFTNLIHFNDARQNYDLIVKQFPRFLKVVPLKHIASRLNMSQVHVSRIRAEIAKEK